jgi:serine/threonine protein kinase
MQPGERFGRYELVSWLGRGGMAETYRARLLGEAGVTKPVLIKKVLPEYTNDQAFIAMFISEARISATLSHGNIAQVYDFGRVDGDYFLAMEYVDGQPLHRTLKRAHKSGMRTMPVLLSAFISLELCRGLHYAHSRTDDKGQLLGIVHRDISPDNVIISYEGQVKIVDFGIAKARELRGFSTEPGVVKGKYLFFSPEQARGDEVDARTDVWSTGVVLYEMLCGKLPVEDAPDVAVPKLMTGQFPRPRELNPSLPEELEAIVMKALAVRRDERYLSSHAFGDALAGFLAATAPRFSAMELSHFVQELFRDDITNAGRQVQVPGPFREQFAQWREQGSTAVMSPSKQAERLGAMAALPTQPFGSSQAEAPTDPDPSAPVPGASPMEPLTIPDTAARQREARPAKPPTSDSSRLMVAAGVGVVLLMGAIAGTFIWLKRSAPVTVSDSSNDKTAQSSELPPSPPPQPALPPAPESPMGIAAADLDSTDAGTVVAEGDATDAGTEPVDGGAAMAELAPTEIPAPSPEQLEPGCYVAVVAFESSREPSGRYGPWMPQPVASRTPIRCSAVPRQGNIGQARGMFDHWPAESEGKPLHYSPQSFEPQKKGDPKTRRMVVRLYTQVSQSAPQEKEK